MVSTLTMTVANVDFASLTANPAIQAAFQSAVQGEVAAAAGVPRNNVNVVLSDGSVPQRRLQGGSVLERRLSESVAVEATVSSDGGVDLQAAHSELTNAVNSGDISSAVVSAVSQVPNIDSVATGTIAVSEVTSPTLGVPPPPPTPTPTQVVAALAYEYSAPFGQTDLTLFRTEFLSRLQAAGVNIGPLSVSFREGSIIVTVSGPAPIIQTIAGIELSSLAVLGYTPARFRDSSRDSSTSTEPQGVLTSSVSSEDEQGLMIAIVAIVSSLACLTCLLCMVVIGLMRQKRANDQAALVRKKKARHMAEQQVLPGGLDAGVMNLAVGQPPRVSRLDLSEVKATRRDTEEYIVDVQLTRQAGGVAVDGVLTAGEQQMRVEVNGDSVYDELGIAVKGDADGYLRVRTIFAGMVRQWNQEVEGQKVRPGDMVVSANGVGRGNLADLVKILQAMDPGILRLRLLRTDWGRDHELEVALEVPDLDAPAHRRSLGIDVLQVGAALKIKRINEGLVHQWNEELARKQVRPDDRILQVDSCRGPSGDLARTLSQHKPGRLRIWLQHEAPVTERRPDYVDIYSPLGPGMALANAHADEEIRKNKMPKIFKAYGDTAGTTQVSESEAAGWII